MESAADRRFRALRIASCCFAAVLAAAHAAGAEPYLERVQGPRYPGGALLRGETGTAQCLLEVDPSGQVTAVEVEAENLILADEARTAALGFRFQRSTEKTVVKIVFRFELEPGEAVPLPPAPYGTVHLHVAEAGLRSDIAGATAVGVGFGVGGVTAGKGDVVVRLPAGEVTILVAAPEFKPLQVQLEIAAGANIEETVYLYRAPPGCADPHPARPGGAAQRPGDARRPASRRLPSPRRRPGPVCERPARRARRAPHRHRRLPQRPAHSDSLPPARRTLGAPGLGRGQHRFPRRRRGRLLRQPARGHRRGTAAVR